MSDLLVLGAGLAGLSAAHHLGRDCEVFEKEGRVGGHCRTKQVGGFAFDEGAHVFFGKDECAEEFVRRPLAGRLVTQRAEIWNHYEDQRFGPYPVQANLRALRPELAARCLLSFIEACHRPEPPVRTYEEWCKAAFGDAFAEEFMLRYARKVWTVEPRELTTEWLGSNQGSRISRPTLEQVVKGALDPAGQELNYLTEFAYPDRGGFEAVVEPLARLVPAVRVGAPVVRIDAGARLVTFGDGQQRKYRLGISTLPLPVLVAATVDAPEEVRAAAARLRYTSIRLVNLGISRADLGPGHWVYFYDHQIPFFRLSFPSKLAAANAPPGQGSISCEIAYSKDKPLEEAGLTERVIDALCAAGILRSPGEVVLRDQLDIPHAYVIFDFARTASLATIHAWMESVDLLPCGRFGEWGYHWSFDAIASGKRVAELARQRLDPP